MAKPKRYDEFRLQRAVCINVDKYGVPGLVYWHVPNGGARDDLLNMMRSMGAKNLPAMPQ